MADQERPQPVRPISALNPDKAKPGFQRLGASDSEGKVEIVSAHGDSHPTKPIRVVDKYSKNDQKTEVDHRESR